MLPRVADTALALRERTFALRMARPWASKRGRQPLLSSSQLLLPLQKRMIYEYIAGASDFSRDVGNPGFRKCGLLQFVDVKLKKKIKRLTY